VGGQVRETVLDGEIVGPMIGPSLHIGLQDAIAGDQSVKARIA
jgi:hypothetical protein